MEKKYVKEKVKEIILSTFDELVDDDFDLDNYMTEMNSIKFLEIIPKIEIDFNIEIYDNDLVFEKLSSIDKIVDLILKYK